MFLTAEADTVLQRLRELRAHANKLILVLLDALLPVEHGFADHVLDGCTVHRTPTFCRAGASPSHPADA
jgi:hypothetical protein